MATYKSLSVFRKPMCLIENGSDGKLKTCNEVLNQLKQIGCPLNVIAITGPSRAGKSYLLNYLAEKRKGFPVGSTIEAKTKGIWVWCQPHQKRQDEVLLLLDTEGLGDAKKGDEENDSWIFALSVLLSSTLVYNCMNTIEIANRIKSRDTSTDGEELFTFFPNFVWALRDFHLHLEKEGKPITSDDYLLDALQLMEGTTQKIKDYNSPRQCICQFFQDKKCFILPMPVKDCEKLEELETLSKSKLNSKFLDAAEKFCSYIYTRSFPKTANGQPIHGNMFCHLLEAYLNVIQSGEVLCADNAVLSMAKMMNAKAVQVSLNLYETKMTTLLQGSINTEEELIEASWENYRRALECFMSMSTLDEKQEHLTEFYITFTQRLFLILLSYLLNPWTDEILYFLGQCPTYKSTA